MSSSTTYDRGGILRGVTAGMASSKTVIIGHLTVTFPTILLVGLTMFYGYYMYGGPWFYTLAGIAVGWRWYSFALGRWKHSLRSQGLGEAEIDVLAASSGLEWPGATQIGSLSLHTAAACVCATPCISVACGEMVRVGYPTNRAHNSDVFRRCLSPTSGGGDDHSEHLWLATLLLTASGSLPTWHGCCRRCCSHTKS